MRVGWRLCWYTLIGFTTAIIQDIPTTGSFAKSEGNNVGARDGFVLSASSSSSSSKIITRSRSNNNVVSEFPVKNERNHPNQAIEIYYSWLNIIPYISFTNIVINLLRPDPDIAFWQRLPRCFWEMYVAVAALFAADGIKRELIFQKSWRLMLLIFMTGTTAIIDIFVWAPLFAVFTSFQTCEGGIFTGKPYTCYSDYTKGFGRLFVSILNLILRES